MNDFRSIGLAATVNTQITARTMPHLPALMDIIIEAGAKFWQIQLTVAMGNAVDHDEILLQPYELATLMPLLAELHGKGRERDHTLLPGNNIGYFGPREVLWRGPDRGYYSGCPAGQNVIGLEAGGTLKGCPSLATERYGAGGVRTTPIAEMWANHPALEFNRNRGTSDLWGFCKTCYYGRSLPRRLHLDIGLAARRGNNPYRHHRVLNTGQAGFARTHREGRRSAEVAVRGRPLCAGGRSHSGGGGPCMTADPLPPRGIAAPVMVLCRQCLLYVFEGTRVCPHCGSDAREIGERYRNSDYQAIEAMQRIDRLRGA